MPLNKRYLELSLVILNGLFVSCSYESSYGPHGPGGYGGMMHYGFGGIFMWIIFLIAIVLLVYFIVQTQKMKGRPPTQSESHMDILKKRYAKGEITKEEYERMKKDLE